MMNFLKSSPAIVAGLLYALGVLITAIHLSRFGISELDLTRVRYVFAGAAFCYFLLLRIVVAAIVLDFRMLWKMSIEATELAVNELRRSRALKLIDELSRLPFIGNLIVDNYGSEALATRLIQTVTLGSVLVLFAGFSLLLSTPSDIKWRLEPLPAFVLGMVQIELAYLVYFIFNRPMRSAARLAGLWNCVLIIILLVDICFYSIFIHPLVRPVFGGGVVTTSQILPKDALSTRLLEGTGFIRVTNGISNPLYVLHSTEKSVYLASQFKLDVFTDRVEDFIRHSRVIQISKDLLAGQLL